MRRCTCWLCSICSCRIVSAALGPLCIPYVGPLCIPYVGTCCSVHQAGTRRLAAGAQARVRECPDCKKRFYKTEGCNKMTCSCGTLSCYICRQKVDKTVG